MNPIVRKWIAVSLALASGAFFLAQVHQHLGAIGTLRWSSATVAAMLAAIAVQTAMLVCDGYSWSWLLRALGVDADTRQVLAVFSLSQFAKYLPGNIGHHVGRVFMARQMRWQTGRIVLSLMMETGIALGSGALVAGIGALFVAIGRDWNTGQLALSFGVLVVVSMAGSLLIRAVLRRPPPWLRRLLAIEDPIDLRFRFLLGYLMVHVSSHLSMGVAVALLLRGIGGQWPANLWTLPVTVIIAWLAGFVVPGAPAGLGVREATLTSLLGGTLGAGAVISAAILWRLTTLATDALVFGLGLLLRRDRSAASAPHVP